MSSSVLDNLGTLHVSMGLIDASNGTDAVLAGNDGSATLTRDGTGQYTVTFGDAFVSAPHVTANCVDATFATTEVHGVTLRAVSTASAAFDIYTSTTNGTATDILSALADIDFQFVAIGTRNN